MGMALVMSAGICAITTGILGLALGFACTGDRSLGVRVCLTVAAGIGGAALGAVAVYCFFVANF